MNSRIISALVLAVTLSASASSSLSAAPKTASAVGYWASEITVNSWDTMLATSRSRLLVVGSARTKVLSLLGEPRQRLAPDVYVYDNCQPDQSVARDRDCNILIVTFAQDQVANLKFVNHRGMETIAANVLRDRTERQVAGAGQTVDVGLSAPRK